MRSQTSGKMAKMLRKVTKKKIIWKIRKIGRYALCDAIYACF